MLPILKTPLLATAVAALTLPLAASQPNILFIFSDDHRHDLLGKKNPLISTPNLDSLADSGVRFDRAYVTTAICSPSRAACLSGRYGSRNGVPTLSDPLSFPFATFAHDLAAAGYKTAQAGKWHLGTTPSAAGFQDYARINSNGSWFTRNIDTNIAGAPTSLGGTFYETVMADVVIDWIDNHTATSPSQPFVMWWCNQVPHVDGGGKYPDVKTDPNNKVIHTPAGSVGGYRNTYNVADMEVPANWADDPSLWGPAGTKPGYLATSRFVTRSATANYGGTGGYTNPIPGVRNATLGEDNVQQHQLEFYSSVSALDAEIGRVLDRLEDPNGDSNTDDSILDNTWVIFMGDNGWQTGHHKFTSKVLAYEESCRVPLLIKAPGVSPRVENKFALNIDLTTMFYDLAGLAPPTHLQGDNLRALVENPAASWRSQFYYEAVTPENSLGAEPHDAIRTDQYKLIRTYATEADAKANTNIVFTELYDLAADPIETINQAENPAFSAIRSDLTTQLELEKAAIASSPDPESPPVSLTTPDLLTNPSFDDSPYDSGWTNSGLATGSTAGLVAGSTQAALLDGVGSLSQDVPRLTNATLDFHVEPLTSQGSQTFELRLSEVSGGGATPTVISRTAVADTYLREASANDLNNKNWGNDPTDGGEFLLGGNNSADMRPQLRFDLSGISAPAGQSLSHVTLGLTTERSTASSGELLIANLHEYGFDFVEGSGNGSTGSGNGATWNDPDGDDVDAPGGADGTAGGTLGTLLSTTSVNGDTTLPPSFPSSSSFVSSVNSALGGNYNLILDPDRTNPSTTWSLNDFSGFNSRENSGGTPATLQLTFSAATSTTPVIQLRGTAAGSLEVFDGSSWTAVAGSGAALAMNQTTRIQIVLRDFESIPPSYDLVWSDPGSTVLAHSSLGLTTFANAPSQAGIQRLEFMGDSSTEGTAAVDALSLVSIPADGIRNGDLEDSPYLSHWLSSETEQSASFTDSSSSTAARFPFNVPSWLAQKVVPTGELTLSTLFQISGASNSSLNLFLSDGDFDTSGNGEIIGVRIPTGGGLQVNAGSVWVDLLENGTNSPVALATNTTYQLDIIARDLGTPAARWDLSWSPTAAPGSVEGVAGLTTFASLERATTGDGVQFVAFRQFGITPSNSFLIDDVSLSPSAGAPPTSSFYASGLDGNDAGLLSWAAAQGIDPAIGSAAITALDDDLDTIPGLLEYALGLSLVDSDVIGNLIAAELSPSGPVFTFTSRTNDPSLVVTPENSSLLTPVSWSPFPAGDEIGDVDQSGVPEGFLRRSFDFPDEPTSFGRLEVEIP